MKTEAVVFDMDGVLIDSEPLWRKAEMAVFARRGVWLSEEDCKRWTGLRTDELVKQVLSDTDPTLPADEIGEEIIRTVCGLIAEEGRVIEGFRDLALRLHAEGVPLAVATSSPMRVVDTVLARARLENVFSAVVSAEKFPHGKPHPQVYLEACERLGKLPQACVAMEDSLNGTLAAKAARMKAIAIPEPENAENPGFGIADFVVRNAEEAEAVLRALL